MSCCGAGIFTSGQSCLSPGTALFSINLQRFHGREVEHDPTVRDAMPRDAVTTTANSQLQPGVARERDDARHLSRVCDSNDGGWPAIEPAVENGARLVVSNVARRNHVAVEGGAELWNRDVFNHR